MPLLIRTAVSTSLVVWIAVITGVVATVSTAAAAGCGNGLSPDRTLEGTSAGWALQVEAVHECRGGVRVELTASRDIPGDRSPARTAEHPLGPSGIFTVPIFCRRDDYMFLPPDTLAGLPCASV